MHRSVLQNKKYIKFADANTVEVLSLGRLEEGIEKEDRRAGTYKGKDGKDYLVAWPNLTVEDIQRVRSSRASRYNDTGRTPYTAIVNPHTLEKMSDIRGGYGVGMLVDLVKESKKELEKEHGKSITRKQLRKVTKQEEAIRAELAGGKLTGALAAVAKLEKSVAKSPKLLERSGTVRAEVLSACGEKLDELEAQIGRGEKKPAAKELAALARALKGTPLKERAADLLAKAKAE